MNQLITVRCLWVVLVGFALLSAGCGMQTAATVATHSGSTVDQVCAIAAENLGADPASVTSGTSLADLGADDLDFVELVMALEEHFSISIPDDMADRLMGPDGEQVGNITMAKLAELVDAQH